MKYVSTRGGVPGHTLGEALAAGLAPDAGLYVPERIPEAAVAEPAGEPDLAATARDLLAPFFEGDPLARSLPAIAAEAFACPAPLRPVQAGPEALSLLELFHGPTAAFKDFGARFLAACLARMPRPAGRPATILVATSGDTGGAVAAAFHRRPGFRVALLFPAGKVSKVQEAQLTCWGDNVLSLAVHGDFDDCQRLVREAFRDAGLARAFALGSANSINVGRLLPQMTWFAAASLAIRRQGGGSASFVIPSGNLGHATACAFARAAGMPIGDILLAHNANRAVPDFLAGGDWQPRASVPTLASAMDVGDPSNMERLAWLYGEPARLRANLSAVAVGDDAIRDCIRRESAEAGLTLCPHTAAGVHAYRALPQAARRAAHWVVVATAHPAKFPEVVEPLTGRPVAPPAPLAALMRRPTDCHDLDPRLGHLRETLFEAFGRMDHA